MGFSDFIQGIGAEDLGEGCSSGVEQPGLVEICSATREADILPALSYRSTLGPVGGGPRRGTRAARGSGDSRLQAIEENLMRYPCTPMLSTIDSEPWLANNTLKYIRETDSDLKLVIGMLKSRICTWNFFDFKILYERQSCQPMWDHRFLDTSSYYYDVEGSVNILVRLLEYQFNKDVDLIVNFLTDLYNVCERLVPKLNTIVCVSPHSAGKNFFFDMVLNFYWNRGQMGNPNKHNAFAYQECHGKRIILWNEPNYESSETDMLKMVLGGDNYNVRVKNLPDVSVARTPVIVLSNTERPFMQDPTFDNRIRVYRWSACSDLKEYSCKPTPLAFPALLEYYNIV